MRMLHITTYLQGGAGRIITLLARLQKQEGHEVAVAATASEEPGYGNYEEYLEYLRQENMLVLVENTFKRSYPLNLHAVHQVRQCSPFPTWDVIHAHAAIPALIGMLLSQSQEQPSPVVQTMHGWGCNKTRDQVSTDVAVMNLEDAVVAVSSSDGNLLANLGVNPCKIRVIPNGLPADFRTLDRPPEFANLRSKRTCLFACVGSVGKRKNQALLLEAAALMDRPDTSAVVCIGEGPDIPELEERARRLGQSDRFIFLGYRPAAESFIQHADFLVLPSLSEGLPISVLEAMRAEVPVIAGDIPELKKVVLDRQTGFLFPSGDANALAKVLDEAASLSPEQRIMLGQAGRRLFKRNYTAERMSGSYLALYEEVRRLRGLS